MPVTIPLMIPFLAAIISLSIIHTEQYKMPVVKKQSTVKFTSNRTSKHEDFRSFFNKFQTVKDTQLSRIKFPLKKIQRGDDEDRVSYIKGREWKYVNYKYLKGSNFIITSIKVNEAQAVFSIVDTGVHVTHIFVNRHCKWYLELIIDEST